MAFLFRWLPISISRLLGRGVGALASRVIRLRKRIAIVNILRAFPEMSPDEAEKLYHEVWTHFGMMAAEISRTPRLGSTHFEGIVGEGAIEVVRKALDRGKGAIFASGHLGNWEWLGAITATAGIPISYVVTTQTNKLVERWMDRMRMRPNVEIIARRDAVKGVLGALKRNRVVAMLCDQDAGTAGVFVPFFGKLASTPRGPAVFHLKTGAALIFGSCCRDGGKYCLEFEELRPQPPTGIREEDEQAIMTRITTRLEEEIRKYPGQYMWLHRRWKTPPP